MAAIAEAQTTTFNSVAADAQAARDRGDRTQAIQLYTQAIALKPDWPEGWWSIGTLAYSMDQYAPAEDALTHFIRLTPTAGPALALRGLCEYESGQYSASLQDLQSGIEHGAATQPKNAQIVLYHEALVLTKLGRFEEATAKYSYFVKHATVNPELETAVGLAGLRMPLLPTEVDAAKAQLVSMVGHAAIPVMDGDLAAGRADFEQVFQQYPATPDLHYFYGYLLFAAHSDEAAVQFEQEIDVAPQSAIAHAMLAWVIGFSGDYAAALPSARAAATEDPSLPLGLLTYGRALIETGDVDAGLPYIEKVLLRDPENLEAHLTLAKAYSKLGRVADARQEREICLQMADKGGAPGATP